MNDATPRLYGMDDPDNRQDAAENGMRGEGAADVDGPTYHRTISPDDQPPIEVEQVSGVAFVEASRVAPHDAKPPAASLAVAPVPPERSSFATPEPTPSAWPWIVVSLTLGYMAGRRRAAGKTMVSKPVIDERFRGDLDQVLV